MNTDWLAELAPAHAPQPPSWWPPAPGWWVLAALLVAAVAVAVAWRINPRRRLTRAALAELRAIDAAPGDPAETARAVQNLLRRYALAVFGPERVARLSGDAWLQFIAARGAASLGGPLGASLLRASYGSAEAERADPAAWCAAAERFLRRAAQRDRRVAGSRRPAG